jgi:hypothetical protein
LWLFLTIGLSEAVTHHNQIFDCFVAILIKVEKNGTMLCRNSDLFMTDPGVKNKSSEIKHDSK